MKMMKKILCLFHVLLLLLAALTSCIRFPLYQNDADNNGGVAEEPEPDTETNLYEEFEGQPYLITYRPDGIGRCTVIDIRINPNYTEDFELIIPKRAPDGRYVKHIGMSNYESDGYFHFYPVPRMLTEEDFSELQALANAKYEQGEITSHEFSLFNIMYTRVAYAEETSDAWKAELLERYPYAESLTFYALHSFPTEWMEGYGEVLSHLGYTVQDLMEDEANFRRAVEKCEFDDKEAVLKKLPFIADRISSHVVGIQIPQSVTTIGSYSFAGCARVESIALPSNLTSIPDYAFYACTNLRTLEIPNGVKTIGDYAFAGCKSLRLMELPGELTSIGECAFYECKSLMLTQIPDSVTRIGRYAFMNTHLIYAEAPEYKLAYFDGWLMSANSNMLSVSVRSGCVGIADEVFRDHQYLKSVTLPEGVTRIGADAFNGCYNLEYVVIPSTVTSIGADAFEKIPRNCMIYYGGTEANWDRINGSFATNLLKTVYFYSETKPTDNGHYWHYVNGVPKAW